MPRHLLNTTPNDFLNALQSSYAAGSTVTDEDRSEMRRDLFTNRTLFDAAQTRMQNSEMDASFIGRLLGDRCIEVRYEYEEDRPNLFFLDMFRERNLFWEIKPGIMASLSKSMDYAAGDVRFIGDKVDDLPTTGANNEEFDIHKVKYYGKSVEYGRLELWQASCEGRDIVNDRIRAAYLDVDEFENDLIATGSINHGFYGFLNHPDIPVLVLPATTGPLAPNTDWPSKTPNEVMADLQLMVDTVRSASNYNLSPDTLIIPDMRYSFINTGQIGINGESIAAAWMRQAANLPTGGLQNFVPFLPYDTAAPGNLPMATAGTFDRRFIEKGLMPIQQLETQTHALKWKIPFIGASGSVEIKRKGRFASFTGL